MRADIDTKPRTCTVRHETHRMQQYSFILHSRRRDCYSNVCVIQLTPYLLTSLCQILIPHLLYSVAFFLAIVIIFGRCRNIRHPDGGRTGRHGGSTSTDSLPLHNPSPVANVTDNSRGRDQISGARQAMQYPLLPSLPAPITEGEPPSYFSVRDDEDSGMAWARERREWRRREVEENLAAAEAAGVGKSEVSLLLPAHPAQDSEVRVHLPLSAPDPYNLYCVLTERAPWANSACQR